jgi:deoxycytidylate deaminase
MSDLIIFEALISKKEIVENEEQKTKVDKCQEITKREDFCAKIDDIKNEIKELNPQAVDLKELKNLLDSNLGSKDHSDRVALLLLKVLKLIRSIKEELKSHEDYRIMMQDFGDNIRRTGNPFDYSPDMDPSKTRKTRIHQTLASDAELLITFLFKARKHSFFIVDAFRNPYEAFYFKDRYVNFFLISMHAPREIREKRLKDKFDKESEKRDQGGLIEKIEDHFCMQNVPKTVKFSDIAINNDKDLPRNKDGLEKDELIKKLVRYLALIFDTGCTKPDDDEVMMNLAYTMAMKSNCISRQVGAVVVGKDGYVVGAGWNDVGEGKISCGLREIKDLKLPWYEERYTDLFGEPIEKIIEKLVNEYSDGQDYKPEMVNKFCFCFKDEYSEKQLKTKLTNRIGWDGLSEDCKEFIDEEVSVKRLEYCQALHAEENAIIQTSKIGGMGMHGGKIYTTSAPCELCAKKIQQVGISEIIYTEPYPGISEQVFLRKAFSKISVRQFEGVMPHSYFRLFKVSEDQKEWQEMYNQGFVW